MIVIAVQFEKTGVVNASGEGVNPNLILDSSIVTRGGNGANITRSYEADGSVKIIASSSNGNYAFLGFARDSNDNVGANMSVGDPYTISCDAKIESGTVLPTLFINGGNSYKQLNPVNGTIITGKWMRVFYTSTWNAPGTSYGNIALHLGFSGAIGTYYFRNFKLEKGSVPTPWIPNETDNIYVGSTLGFTELETIPSIGKAGYVQATEFIEW